MPSTSTTDIANMAVMHLGLSKPITNMDSDQTAAANAVRRFFTITRDALMRDFPYPFSTKFANLALVATSPAEAPEWGFSYRYPPDCLKMRRIPSGALRLDDIESRIPYKIGADSSGKLIYTDMQAATAEYTVLVTDTAKWDSDFVLAVSLRLAAYIAPAIAGGDPFKLGTRAMNLYLQHLGLARVNAVGEEQLDQPPESSFIEDRS